MLAKHIDRWVRPGGARERDGTAGALPRMQVWTRVLFTVILAPVAACGGGHSGAGPAEAPAIDVAIVTVIRADLPQVYEAGGVVRARTTAAITSRLLAPVMEVRVAPGDRVRAGQVLLQLDDRDLSAQQRRAASGRQAAEQAGRGAAADRDAATSALALASAYHKRILMLHERKSATDDELDHAVASLRSAESGLAAAEARIAEAGAGLSAAEAGADAATVGASWASVRAPFDGTITEKLVEPGNMASPGMPLLRIEQAGALRLDVRLDEARASVFHAGQSVEVRFDSGIIGVSSNGNPGGDAPASGATPARQTVPGQTRPDAALTVTGRVAEMARAEEAGPHAFLVKIELPPDVPVTSGTFARARFEGPSRRAVAVPHAAVARRGQITSVFVADGEHARLRLVSIGDGRFPVGGRDLVEVLAGLDAGERVIVDPSPGVREGVRVRGAAHAAAPAAPGAGAR